jgi:hypothetical protein
LFVILLLLVIVLWFVILLLFVILLWFVILREAEDLLLGPATTATEGALLDTCETVPLRSQTHPPVAYDS